MKEVILQEFGIKVNINVSINVNANTGVNMNNQSQSSSSNDIGSRLGNSKSNGKKTKSSIKKTLCILARIEYE